MHAAHVILLLAALYAGIGVPAGLAFIVFGVARVDSAAAGSPWMFRLLIWPGAAALWPLVLARWLRATGAGAPPASAVMRANRRRHLIAWLVLTPAVVGVLAAALAARAGAGRAQPGGPDERRSAGESSR